MNTQGFAVMSSFKQLKSLLWGRVQIYMDDRNIAYILIEGAPLAGFQSGYIAPGELENGDVLLRLCGTSYDFHGRHRTRVPACLRTELNGDDRYFELAEANDGGGLSALVDLIGINRDGYKREGIQEA